jgi:hypothetical protein
MAHLGRFERQTIGGKVKAALTMALYRQPLETKMAGLAARHLLVENAETVRSVRTRP